MGYNVLYISNLWGGSKSVLYNGAGWGTMSCILVTSEVVLSQCCTMGVGWGTMSCILVTSEVVLSQCCTMGVGWGTMSCILVTSEVVLSQCCTMGLGGVQCPVY